MRYFCLAASFLILVFTVASAQDTPVPKPTPRVLTWSTDAPFADSYKSEGADIRVIKDNGLLVAVVGYDAKDHMICEVAVVNQSEHRVDILPKDFFLAYTDKDDKLQIELPLPGKQLAGKYSSRAKWGTFFRAFVAGMATTTSNASTSGDIYSSQGSRVGTYEGNTTTTTPNVNAQRNAAEANRRSAADAAAKGAAVINAELLANTLFPKQYISGMVYFSRKKMDTGRFFVAIDGTFYVFRFGAIK